MMLAFSHMGKSEHSLLRSYDHLDLARILDLFVKN
jgi:hypothetical protein